MNKILSLALISLFLASIVVGLIPAQGVISNPLPPQGQGIKVISLGSVSTSSGPHFAVLVVINASQINTGGYTPAQLGQAVTNTLSNTQITLTITDTSGNPIPTTSPNPVTIVFTTTTLKGYFYNDSTDPKQRMIFFIIFIDSNTAAGFDTLSDNSPVINALGISYSSTVYDQSGNEVTIGTTSLKGAAAGQMQVFGNGALYTQPIWMDYLSNPNNIITNNYELWVRVTSTVKDAAGNTVASLTSLNTLVLAPFVFYLFNPINGQQAGVGRSLLNVTAIIGYALAAGQTTTDVLFQLTFTAPTAVIPFLQFANVTSLSPSQLVSGSLTTIFDQPGYIGPTLPVYAQDGLSPSGLYPISGFYLPSQIVIGGTPYNLQPSVYLANSLSFPAGVINVNIINCPPSINVLLVNSKVHPAGQSLSLKWVCDASPSSPYITTTGGPVVANVYGVAQPSGVLYQYLILIYSGPGVIYIALPLKPVQQLPTGNIRLSLTTTAYERITMTQVGGNYTGFLMTTPNVPLLITGQAQGAYTERLEQSGSFYTLTSTITIGPFPSSFSMKISTTAGATYYTNFTLIGLTPELPNLVGLVGTVYQEAVRLDIDPSLSGPRSVLVPSPSAVQFVGTTLTEAQFGGASNPIIIAASPSQLPYIVTNANYPVGFALSVPSPLSYVAMVQLGLWSLTTVVQVKAFWLGQPSIVGSTYTYSTDKPAVNMQTFRAIISPPQPLPASISLSPSQILSIFCGQSPVTFKFRSPDDILYPAAVLGSYNPSPVTVIINTPVGLPPTFTTGVPAISLSIPPGPGPIGSNDVTSNNVFLQGSAVPFSGISVKVISGSGSVVASKVTMPSTPRVLPDPFAFTYSFTLNIALGSPTSISINPGNVISVALDPSVVSGAKIQVTFTTSDYAIYYDFPTQVNATVTIQLPAGTAQVLMPPVTSLANQYANVTLYNPYWSQPLTTIVMNVLNPGTVQLTLVTPQGNIYIGNITKISVKMPDGSVKVVSLTSQNVMALFGNAGQQLQETGACTGAYITYLNLDNLASILGLPSRSALNGSILNVTAYDVITGKYIYNTTLLLLSKSKINAVTNASVFHVLTARYVGPTQGIPVEIAFLVTKQPFFNITVPDLVSYSSSALQVSQIIINGKTFPGNQPYVVNINIVGTSVMVYVNNNLVQTATIASAPTIPGISGTFVGSPFSFYVVPGNLDMPFGTLYLNISNASINLGNSSYFVRAPIQAVNGSVVLSAFSSQAQVVFKDVITGLTITVPFSINPVIEAPIRLSVIGQPLPLVTNPASRTFYFYTTPIVLAPVGASQYINLQLTTTLTYPFPFYIETIVYAGAKVNPSSPGSLPLLVNFQTVVPAGGPFIPGNVVQVPVQLAGTTPLKPGSYTVVFFAVPYASPVAPAISDYPTFLVISNVTVKSS
jgi:hypothetical protein